MKIKASFVTNSSSTSYCIYGIEAEGGDGLYDKIMQRIKDKNKNIDEEDFEEGYIDYLDEFLEHTSLVSYYNWDCQRLHIGIDPSRIQKDFADIKVKDIPNEVAKKINDVFGLSLSEKDISIIEDSYYS
jgi:hypothetical protein